MNFNRYVIMASLAIVLASGGVQARESESQEHRSPNHDRFFSESAYCKHVLKGELLNRTELIFGLSRPGGVITEEEFQEFVDSEVTRRFPDGLTLVAAKGQFKGANGNVIQEGSKILILLYSFSLQRHVAVDEIRSLYKTQFNQESVLRIDERSCVSF